MKYRGRAQAEGPLAVKRLGLFCSALCGRALLALDPELAGVLPPHWSFQRLLLFLRRCFEITQQNPLSNSFIIFYKGSPPFFFIFKDAVKLHFLRFMVDLLCLTLLHNLNTQQQEGLNATVLTQCQRPLRGWLLKANCTC